MIHVAKYIFVKTAKDLPRKLQEQTLQLIILQL
jgi:hypothetical protein